MGDKEPGLLGGAAGLSAIGIYLVQFCTVTRLKKVSYGTSIIQKSRRVALDPNLLDTLNLKEGDKVRVELDTDSATILIRKAIAVASARRSRGGELSRA